MTADSYVLRSSEQLLVSADNSSCTTSINACLSLTHFSCLHFLDTIRHLCTLVMFEIYRLLKYLWVKDGGGHDGGRNRLQGTASTLIQSDEGRDKSSSFTFDKDNLCSGSKIWWEPIRMWGDLVDPASSYYNKGLCYYVCLQTSRRGVWSHCGLASHSTPPVFCQWSRVRSTRP